MTVEDEDWDTFSLEPYKEKAAQAVTDSEKEWARAILELVEALEEGRMYYASSLEISDKLYYGTLS